VTREVWGGVRPDTYPLSGGLVLKATAEEILAEPRFPLIKVNLKVDPSRESWDSVQKILDEKEGVCGYVLDKVDVRAILERLVNKGFNVRLPTEKIKPMAVPVGIEPTMEVRGQPVALGIKLGRLAITEQMIWLGANVSVATGAEAAAKVATATAPARNTPAPKPTAAEVPAR